MRDLKYILVVGKNIPAQFVSAMTLAIVFNGMINHADVVPEGFNVVGAGFCVIVKGEVTVHGASSSLKISSKPQDALVISRTINRMVTGIPDSL